jgi:alpha-beta hydrolase superfamily lysophospholipase
MCRAFAAFVYLVLLAAGFAFSHSTSGFLFMGLGPALLVDRYVLRRLPWPRPVVWTIEVPLRAGYFLLGALATYFVRFGLVPVSEAVSLGACFSIGAFFFESLFDLVTAAVHRSRAGSAPIWPTAWARNASSAFLFLASLAFAAPLEALHPLRTVPKRTPAMAGLAFEEVQFTTADGMQLTGWLVPHHQARGNVIFCHGHGRNREHGTGFLPTFHELGLNVLAFDFRGHGDSAGHTATFGKREVHDIVAAATFLSARFPGKPLFLVGVSYGAAIALQALPQLPDVRAVWCEGCFGRFMSVVDHQFSGLPGALRNRLIRAYQLLAWLDCGFSGPDTNPGDRLSEVHIPIYFCHALNDELVPFSDGKGLYDSYAGPKASYWVQGAKHYDLRRRNREEYLFRLKSFLEQNLAETTS